MSDPGRRDNAWWFSKLQDYRTCAAYYKAKHIDKTVPSEGSLDTEFGTAIHLGVNDILQGGDGEEMFMTFWESVDPDMKRFSYSKEELTKMAPVMLARFKRLHAPNLRPVMMEERMFGELQGELIEGTPDFLGYYRDVASIVDFKTSGSRYDKRKIVCEEQLSFYAYLSSLKLDFVPLQRVYVVFIKSRSEPSIQVLKAELTKVDINSTMMNVSSTIKRVQSETDFPRNPASCVRGPIICPAFESCWGKRSNDE